MHNPMFSKVVVGGPAGLVFTPPTIVAAIGDIVSFEFHSKNHTATQSLFISPCTKATVPAEGFDSAL
jgi:plastocyanin